MRATREGSGAVEAILRNKVEQGVSRVLEGFLRRKVIPSESEDFENLASAGIDSLGMIEIVFDLSDEFDLQEADFPNEQLPNFRSKEDIVQHVLQLKGVGTA